MSILTLTDVSVAYGDLEVLTRLDLRVEPGEIVVVVGSNGAGKTTLMKAICGLLRPKSGDILLDGTPINGKNAYEIASMGIILVPEGRHLWPDMTVMDNLLAVGSGIKRTRQKRSKLLSAVFDMFPVLMDRRNQIASTLSGGEQQMLAMARGVMADPDLLLLDEPSLGLAPFIVDRLFEIIVEIHGQSKAILLVEQNVDRSLSIADRGYVLENHQFVMEGSGKELLSNKRLQEAYLGL